MSVQDYRTWVIQAQNGHSEAYGCLVVQFQDMAFGYAYSRLHDFMLAQDVTQEAFIEGFQQINTLRMPEAWPDWLRRLIVKHCDRVWRRKGIRTQPIHLTPEIADELAIADEQLIAQERYVQLNHALQELTEAEQTVITLYYISAYRQKDIAIFLDISVHTVNNRLRTGRRKLKERMLTMAKKTLKKQAPSKDHTLSDHVMMYNACKAGELDLVKKLVNENASLITADGAPESPLAVAVREGHKNIVEYLLEKGATPDQLKITGGYRNATFGGAILEIAEARGHHEIVAYVRETWERRYAIRTEGEALCDAVKALDLERIKSLITSDPDIVNARDEDRNTALHWAVMAFEVSSGTQSFAIIDYLLDCGANLEATNEIGFSPLHYTIWKSNYWNQQQPQWMLAGYLIARGAVANINTAAAMGDQEQVRLFLGENPADVDFCDTNRKRPLSSAAEFGHKQIVDMLLKHGADPNAEEANMCGGSYALYGAAFHNHLACVDMLLTHKANPNGVQDSGPSVCGAAQGMGHQEVAELVASYGGHTDIVYYVNEGRIVEVSNMLKADPSQAQDILGANNDFNEEMSLNMIRLALQYGAKAEEMGHWRLWRYRVVPKSLKMVFEHGANPNVQNHQGVTLLHSYVASGHQVAVEIALEFGADINARDAGYQGTPLSWATRLGNKQMVTLLLSKGAQVHLPDDEPWMTPLFWAESKGHYEIAEVLKS